MSHNAKRPGAAERIRVFSCSRRGVRKGRDPPLQGFTAQLALFVPVRRAPWCVGPGVSESLAFRSQAPLPASAEAAIFFGIQVESYRAKYQDHTATKTATKVRTRTSSTNVYLTKFRNFHRQRLRQRRTRYVNSERRSRITHCASSINTTSFAKTNATK